MATLTGVAKVREFAHQPPPQWIDQKQETADAAVLGLGRQRLQSLQLRTPVRTGILLHFGWLGRTSYELLYSERSADTTSEVEAALSTLSSQGIVLAGAAAVREYLFKHPDMVDLLLSVCAAALERFGPHTQLCLDVYSDPEIEDRYLTLYVRQQSYGPDIQDRIESLAADYEEDLAGKTGWLLLTTDFRSPR